MVIDAMIELDKAFNLVVYAFQIISSNEIFEVWRYRVPSFPFSRTDLFEEFELNDCNRDFFGVM